MDKKQFLNNAKTLQDELVCARRYLHANPEVGFNLKNTLAFIKTKLDKLEIPYSDCGKCGIVALIEGKKSKSKACFLLRADMDALPIKEESDLEFASQNSNMHACGHDMHTAMLLGSAKLLKAREKDFSGTVKLMFQPAEEILAGAKDMLEDGVLKSPKPQAGMMLHVVGGMPMPCGKFLFPRIGVSAPAADYFQITVQGKGCHGSTPHEGIDALTVAAHILLGLQEIPAREFATSDEGVLTIGVLQAGKAGNVIADSAIMEGTLRAYEDELRLRMKTRMVEIAENIAAAYRAKATVEFKDGCPTLLNDETLCDFIEKKCVELLGKDSALSSKNKENALKSAASEDFAYISQEIPTVTLALTANGNGLPLHHPKVTFDENALWVGSALSAYVALQWLEER